MAISCAYCGGAHEQPAEVKACWARHAAGGSSSAAVPDPTARPHGVIRPVVGAVVGVTAGVTAGVVVGAASLSPPAELGRNVVVPTGVTPPAAWSDAPRVHLDGASLDEPASALAALRAAAHERRGVVIELTTAARLGLDPAHGPATVVTDAPHVVGPRFGLDAEELHHLVWSNSIHLSHPADPADRAGPHWQLVDLALAAGATLPDAGVAADVVTPDGQPCWLDGGPVRITEPVHGTPVLHAVAVEQGWLHPPVGNQCAAELANDQLAAVTSPGGAARIIAPAGSGKTRVLTERARHLLLSWQLPPASVSLVAFNKRAQEEMRERTADLPGLQVRTLNAIALAIVNGAPPFAPRSRRYETIDEPEVRRLLGDLVSFPRRRNTDPVAPWIEALGQIRLGLVDPVEVETRYGGDVDGLPEVWPRYRAALERRGAVDFDGQIHGAIELLLGDPGVRSDAQRACRVLLVDEFQDLTPAHLLLVRLLAAPAGTVFGVGDDDQTIYGYNGADPSSLIDFAALFPGADSHPLEVNYRCPADLVDAVDRLLRHNRRRVPKTIRPADGSSGSAAHDGTGSTPTGWTVVTSDDPVGDAVSVVEAARSTGCSPDQIAVLTRVNALLAPIQVALGARGVPISGGVGLEFVERTSVRAVLAWLRLAQGRFTSDDLHEALRRPSRPLPPRVTEWVAEQRDVDGLRRLAARLNVEREAERVAAFADDVDLLRALVASGASVSRLVDVLIDDMGLAGSVATLDATRRGMNRSAQGDDLSAVRQLADLHDDVTDFESWLRDHLALRRSPAGVVLSTVHRVKGQEWPHVVVHLADREQYPHRLADDVEEERRLFHVALTRASTHATVVTGPHPSPFVAELTAEPPDHPPESPARSTARSAATASRAADSPRASGAGAAATAVGPARFLLDRSVVVVAAGIELVDQGATWLVTDVAADHAMAVAGAARRRFSVGEAVVTAGRQRGALRLADGEVPAATARAYDDLRRYRELARGGKPAYTVFDDKTLAAIAVALPSSTSELFEVPGIGPAKLEQYGDDVCDIVEAAIAGPDR